MFSDIEALKAWQRERQYSIKQRMRIESALGAYLRMSLGWSMNLPEKERKDIEKQAAALLKDPTDDHVQLVQRTLDAAEPFKAVETAAVKEMKRIVRSLPIWKSWAADVKGLGELGLAVILAEAGDLSNYPKKGHLWKRLGLAPYKSQSYSTWRRTGGLSAEEWTIAGYSPRRRAEIYAVVSEPLFRAQTVANGPYREIYDKRREKTAETYIGTRKIHSHMDALRVMTKYLLRDLWQEWNGRKAFVDMPHGVEAALPPVHQALDARCKSQYFPQSLI